MKSNENLRNKNNSKNSLFNGTKTIQTLLSSELKLWKLLLLWTMIEIQNLNSTKVKILKLTKF